MRFAGWLVLVVVASCSRPTGGVAIRADDVGTDAARAVPSPPVPSVVPPAKVEVGHCDVDADCAWGPGCPPSRCMARGEPGASGPACDGPVAGPCVCADHRCSAKIASAPPAGACKVDADCGFDPPSGRCAPGIAPNPIVERGGYCRCTASGCRTEWSERVPCLDTRDCSWLENPRRPAPVAKVPRPRPPAKPCVTRSWDSVCRDEACRIEVWKC